MPKATSQPSAHELLARITKSRSQGSPFGAVLAQSASLAGAPDIERLTPKPRNPEREAALAKGQVEEGSDEPFISRRTTKEGEVRFCVQIRRKTVAGQVNVSKTLASMNDAKKWRDDTLARIQLGMVEPISSGIEEPETLVKDLLQKKKDQGRDLERSANQVLDSLIGHRRCLVPASKIDIEWFQNLAKDLLNSGMLPQTAASYMTILAASLKWAHKRDYDVPYDVICRAMAILWEDEILARSESRERRPSLDELDTIFKAVGANKRQKLPIVLTSVFAIFSCRRLGEICRLRWEDLRISKCKILVRNMKHPRKKKTNNVWVKLPPEAMQIILAMPRTSEFIFPFNTRSIGTAFRRHRERADIVDLRFHDLRHEGISRLYEIGMKDHFVADVSGHLSRQCLDRYAHVEESGDKFKDWPWLRYVLDQLNSA